MGRVALQDIEKWRAREANGPNFFFLYLYNIVAGRSFYKVCTAAPSAPRPAACPALQHAAHHVRAGLWHASKCCLWSQA